MLEKYIENKVKSTLCFKTRTSFHFCNPWNTLPGFTLGVVLQVELNDELGPCCPSTPGIICLPRSCSGSGPHVVWDNLASDPQGFTVCNWVKGEAYSSLWCFLIPRCWHNLVERPACPLSGLSPFTNVVTETYTHFKSTAWSHIEKYSSSLLQELGVVRIRS